MVDDNVLIYVKEMISFKGLNEVAKDYLGLRIRGEDLYRSGDYDILLLKLHFQNKESEFDSNLIMISIFAYGNFLHE
jgi:hypothetical protein